jgi:hypothetical protein
LPRSTISRSAKLLQRLGSWVVRVASATDIADAPSGFRAMSRSAAQRMMVFNDYTYTLETLIQAGRKNIAVASVPIRVNEDQRPSRLVQASPRMWRRAASPSCASSSSIGPSTFRRHRVGAVPGGLPYRPRFLVLYLGGQGRTRAVIAWPRYRWA